jgi:hypothetical protein
MSCREGIGEVGMSSQWSAEFKDCIDMNGPVLYCYECMGFCISCTSLIDLCVYPVPEVRSISSTSTEKLAKTDIDVIIAAVSLA